MSIEFPLFAFFPAEPKKRKSEDKADAEALVDAEATDRVPNEVSAASSSAAPPARFEPKPFRVKGGSRRRRKRKSG